MKRIIAMTLILALTLAMFTGCSKTGSQPDGNAQPESTSTASETENKTAYQATFLKLPDGLDTVQSSVFTDGALFLAAMNPSDQTTQEIDETTGAVYGYRSYVSTLYREDLKTGAIDVLELLVEGYGQPQVNALAKAADGSVWAVCQTFEQEPQDGDYIWSFVHFSPDGALLGTVRADFSDSALNVSDVFLQYLALDSRRASDLRGLFRTRSTFLMRPASFLKHSRRTENTEISSRWRPAVPAFCTMTIPATRFSPKLTAKSLTGARRFRLASTHGMCLQTPTAAGFISSAAAAPFTAMI